MIDAHSAILIIPGILGQEGQGIGNGVDLVENIFNGSDLLLECIPAA